MTREELEKLIKDTADRQPHGFKSNLARKLGVHRSYITGMLNGKDPISYQHLFTILDELGLELVVQPKK